MRIGVGRQTLELEIPTEHLVGWLRGPDALPDVTAAVSHALDVPVNFPPLRRALTPEDRLAFVLDDRLPELVTVLTAILDHVGTAGVRPDTITLLCSNPSRGRHWVDDLPERFDDLHVEEHDAHDRQKLAYLAATQAGRRIYLNRTVVDADQIIVLSSRRYDEQLGRAGAEGDLFPGLSDEATQELFDRDFHWEIPDAEPWPLRQEASEVGWLLGMPFHVQVIPGAGDSVGHVISGAAESITEGDRLLDRAWKYEVPQRPELVVATLSGDPRLHSMADVAAAALTATRVVRPGGRVVVLTEANPDIGPGFEVIRKAADPNLALSALEKARLPGSLPALRWARAVSAAPITLASRLPAEMVEDLFAGALTDLAGVQRLVQASRSLLVVEDAHRWLLTV